MKAAVAVIGATAAALWLAVTAEAGYVPAALWSLIFAAVVVRMFHHRRRRWRIAAVLLGPVLIFLYFLPRQTKERLDALSRRG